VEVRGAAGQDDDRTWRVRLQLSLVELFAPADVENAGHDGVDAVLLVPVRHQLHAVRNLDPDHVGPGFTGVADDDSQAGGRRERRERLPVDVLGQDRPEDILAGLVGGHRR